MELPKNVTRVGQADSHCKIYVEDYVMTYLKQMNTLARDKEMAIALYGVRREEESVSYIFIYGAGQMNSLQREVRHMSQAQNQEAEKIRKHHFQDYRFLGYRILNGEMIDGMHICEQGICRYVEGYAQFYEKNDLMLAYMLASRKSDVEPERVNQEKYDKERRKREEVRSQFNQGRGGKNRENQAVLSRATKSQMEQVRDVREQRSMSRMVAKKDVRSSTPQFGQMKVAVILAFALLCMLGVKTVSGSNETDVLQTMGNKIVDKLSEDKILDDTKMSSTSTPIETASADMTLVETTPNASVPAETTPAVSMPTEVASVEAAPSVSVPTETVPAEIAPSVSVPTETVSAETTQESQVVQESQATQESEAAPVQSSPTTYTIAKGDNLIAISVRMYGDDSMVDAICELNQISDPDDIKVGQKILLP